MQAVSLYRNAIYNLLIPPGTCSGILEAEEQWILARLREVFSMAPLEQRFPNEDEDKAMRITWYLVCGLSLAVVLALLMYIFLR